MKLRFVAVVLACVLLATGAWAQFAVGISPRVTGMGGAGVGVADDAAAWWMNPAGLAKLGVPVPDGAEYGTQALLGYVNQDDHDAYMLTMSGWKPSGGFGYGLGYANLKQPQHSYYYTEQMDDYYSLQHVFGMGMGAALSSNLALGLNLATYTFMDQYYGECSTAQFGEAFDVTEFGAGLMYRGGDFSVGLVADDIFDRSGAGTIWSLGAGWKATDNLLVAVDAYDLSDEWDDGVAVSGGVEYRVPDGNRQWFGRVGMMDAGDDHWLTVGVGMQGRSWHVDFALVDSDPDATWSIGLAKDL
ncbi:MAG: hypothetical protein KKI08_03235 [Armatimonadetes bacterium]|nr:hypothetical protein [Armatimonadota bacterium]